MLVSADAAVAAAAHDVMSSEMVPGVGWGFPGRDVAAAREAGGEEGRRPFALADQKVVGHLCELI